MKTSPQKRKLQSDIRERSEYESENSAPLRGRPPKIPPRQSIILSPGKFLTPTKRQKREQYASSSLQKAPAESFVMKLFDRSLDLFKYTEQTSLYPICRAWIKNSPRNPNIPSYREPHALECLERDDNAAEILEKLQCSEIREITTMPAPKENHLSRLPSRNLFDANDDDEGTDTESKLDNASKEELLAKHMKKWKRCKFSWLQHAKLYQKRNQSNNLIIEELFKP